MNAFLAIFTCFSYVFITVMYINKTLQYLKMPVHLRWELYPVIHRENYKYGGSYFEQLDWRIKLRQKHFFRSLLYLLKEYFTLGEYYKTNRGYWCSLYPWHTGFILIITFHILCFLGAVALIFDILISSSSTSTTGVIFYYAIIFTGVVGFISGMIGSAGIFIKRITDNGLRIYATPINYFTYIFTFAVFASGFYNWYSGDPAFSEYREFWKGLITFNFVSVKPFAAIHIILFNLFLIYLPFTRSMHYITRFFAYFLIRWDDEPNLKGGKLEQILKVLLDQKITWAAPHIKAGKKWSEQR